MPTKATKKAPARKSPRRRGAAEKKPDLAHIAEDLRPLATPIAELTPDPANARRHGTRNLETIAASLRQFGQAKPIVVLSDGTIIAGNGTVEAAQRLGWTHVAATRFANAEQARAYALADNRTAELADWDVPMLETQLAELAATEIDIAAIGFDAGEIERLLDGDDAEPNIDPSESRKTPQNKSSTDQSDQLADGYRVLIDCADEAEQLALLERLTEEGLSCRALTA